MKCVCGNELGPTDTGCECGAMKVKPSAASAGSPEIRTEGVATTQFNLALNAEMPALTKNCLYEVILRPIRQY